MHGTVCMLREVVSRRRGGYFIPQLREVSSSVMSWLLTLPSHKMNCNDIIHTMGNTLAPHAYHMRTKIAPFQIQVVVCGLGWCVRNSSHQPEPPLSSDETQVLGLGAALGDARVVEEEGQHHEGGDLVMRNESS